MDWEGLERKYGKNAGEKPAEKVPEKPPEKKKDRRLVIFVLILGLVLGSIGIVVIASMLSLGGAKTLELKRGFRYEYPMSAGYSSSAIEIYCTKEEGNSWEGIVAVKDDVQMMVMLGRFRIDGDLNLSLSNPLSKEEVLDEDIDLYRITELDDPSTSMTVVPFVMLLYNEYGLDLEELIEKGSVAILGATMTLTGPIEHNGYLSYEVSVGSGYGTDTGKIYISTVRPYMLIEASSYDMSYNISKVEQREFNLDDYQGYEEYEPTPLITSPPCSPCFGTQFAYVDYSDGTLELKTGARTIKNLILLADPSVALSLNWVNGTSTEITPGTDLSINGFQTGEMYYLTLNYTDVNSELTHRETAFLQA